MPLSSQLALASSARSAAEARRWVRQKCTELERSDLIEAAEVGVSELVANAVLHGHAPISVRLRGTAGHPRVEVLDGSTEAPMPPAVAESTPDDDDDVLTTVGRGLAMVARVADAWGATIAESGKIVWFEPSSEFHEDGEIEWVIDRMHSEPLEEPNDATVDVLLLGFDLRLHESLNTQYRELRRELRLLSLAHQDEYPMATNLSSMFTTFDRQFPPTYYEQIDAAAASGHERVDLTVPMIPAASQIFVTMSEMFDLADAFCRAERLLSIERTPAQREFHSWLLSEFVRQVDGESARPWKLDAPARTSNVS